MMINALRYEPQGQRQRFEAREQQEQDRHLHLHLTLRARQGRSIHLNASRVTRIFAALIAATVMPLLLLILAWITQDGPPDTLGYIARLAPLVGLTLAWCAVGALLLATWRENPYKRLGLFLLVLLLPIFPFFLLPLFWPLIMAVFIFHPLLTALLLMYVNREARALRQEAPAHSRLSFVMVSGMVLALLGGLLFNLSFLLGGLPPGLFPPVMCGAVIVAIYTLFESRKSRKARPKDASPSDVDSSQEPGEERH